MEISAQLKDVYWIGDDGEECFCSETILNPFQLLLMDHIFRNQISTIRNRLMEKLVDLFLLTKQRYTQISKQLNYLKEIV